MIIGRRKRPVVRPFRAQTTNGEANDPGIIRAMCVDEAWHFPVLLEKTYAKPGLAGLSSIPLTGLQVYRLAFFLFGRSPEKKTGGEKEKVLFLFRAFLPCNP